jgi:hypothetical protein
MASSWAPGDTDPNHQFGGETMADEPAGALVRLEDTALQLAEPAADVFARQLVDLKGDETAGYAYLGSGGASEEAASAKSR